MTIAGMDFGTTNSGLAVYVGQVRLVPLDAANPAAPHVLRTSLYISRYHEHFAGRQAIDEYYRRNQGRPVKLKREYVGTIQLTYAEIGTFYRDVFVWVDVLEPGRLFRSIKTYLPDADYLGTLVWGQFYRLEDLAGAFLLLAKLKAEAELGREIKQVVLGRPVRFGADAKADALAEERLARAAILDGYERVYFQLEPTAAALQYVQGVRRPQTILVFDFGGGTLDVTIMRVDREGRREVLSTGGVRIAGDVFDQKIVLARVIQHLGSELEYGPKKLTMPRHIYEQLVDWQTLGVLNQPETIKFLTEVEKATPRPRPIRALRSLIGNNYGMAMLDAVERCKIELSTLEHSAIRFSGQDIAINESLSRRELEWIIAQDTADIAACVDAALATAQLEPGQIDAVIRTGGSSLIPLFQRMLAQKFGADKLRAIDEFSSVTAGLAVSAHLAERGDLALPAYGPEILTAGSVVAEAKDRPSPVIALREQLLREREERGRRFARP